MTQPIVASNSYYTASEIYEEGDFFKDFDMFWNEFASSDQPVINEDSNSNRCFQSALNNERPSPGHPIAIQHSFSSLIPPRPVVGFSSNQPPFIASKKRSHSSAASTDELSWNANLSEEIRQKNLTLKALDEEIELTTRKHNFVTAALVEKMKDYEVLNSIFEERVRGVKIVDKKLRELRTAARALSVKTKEQSTQYTLPLLSSEASIPDTSSSIARVTLPKKLSSSKVPPSLPRTATFESRYNRPYLPPLYTARIPNSLQELPPNIFLEQAPCPGHISLVKRTNF